MPMQTATAEQAAPESPVPDPIAVLELAHAMAEHMAGFVREQAAWLLPMVLRSAIGFRGPTRRKAIAKLKKMMPAEVFDAIVAESKAP